MTAYKPWLQDMTEAQLRQWLAYQFEQASTGVAKTGVVAGLGVTATTPSPSGSVVVGKGAAICQPSSQAFPLIEPADETFDVFTANPMQFVNNPRNDVIVLDQVTGLVTNLVGTPNAVPSSGEQSVPATAVPLARLRHAANATTIPSTVIDKLSVTVRFAEATPGIDTGWLDLPIVPGGWTVPSGQVRWQARRRGGLVHFRGALVNAAYGSSGAVLATVCTLPAGIPPPPAATAALSFASNTNNNRWAWVQQDGTVQAYTSGASSAWFIIGGSYTVD
jgi:hypothetical protein